MRVSADKGVCIWLTGRSGAGKSTVTKALVPLLHEQQRTVSVLDVVPLLRKQWWERSSEGKLLRKAFVAAQIAHHGGIAICVTVSARQETRDAARTLIGADRFLEVYCDVPPAVSAKRKAVRTKKPPLLKRVRRMVRRLRAVGRDGDAYEAPPAPDLRLDTVSVPPEDNARAIIELLRARGVLSASSTATPTKA
jgi:sulfate adenylyltransferase